MPGPPLTKSDRLKAHNTKHFYQSKIQARSCPDVQGKQDWCECCVTHEDCPECNLSDCTACNYKVQAYGKNGICTTTNNQRCTLCGEWQTGKTCDYKECLKKRCPVKGWEGYRDGGDNRIMWSRFRTRARADPVERFQRCYAACQGNRVITEVRDNILYNTDNGIEQEIELCIRPSVHRQQLIRFSQLPEGVMIADSKLMPSENCKKLIVKIDSSVEGNIHIPFKLNKLSCSFNLIVVPANGIGKKPTKMTVIPEELDMIKGSRAQVTLRLNNPVYNTEGLFMFKPAGDIVEVPGFSSEIGKTEYTVNVLTNAQTIYVNEPLRVDVTFMDNESSTMLHTQFNVVLRQYPQFDVLMDKTVFTKYALPWSMVISPDSLTMVKGGFAETTLKLNNPVFNNKGTFTFSSDYDLVSITDLDTNTAVLNNTVYTEFGKNNYKIKFSSKQNITLLDTLFTINVVFETNDGNNVKLTGKIELTIRSVSVPSVTSMS